MKQINIIGSQMVNDKLRFQHENPLTVSDAEAKRLHDSDMLLDEPVAATSKAQVRSGARKRKKAAAAASATTVPATGSDSVVSKPAEAQTDTDNG